MIPKCSLAKQKLEVIRPRLSYEADKDIMKIRLQTGEAAIIATFR